MNQPSVFRLIAAALLLAGCQPGFWGMPESGALSFAAVFPTPGFGIQMIPEQTRAIAVAVFSETGGGLEAGLVLTPLLPSRNIGLLQPGKRKLLAVAFDANGQALAADQADAEILAGQTHRAELELTSGEKVSDEDLALLRALLRQPQAIIRPGQILPINPIPTASGTPTTPTASAQPAEAPVLAEPSPSAKVTPSPSPIPTITPYPSSGGGGGGGSFNPEPVPTPSATGPTGPTLGGDVTINGGDTTLPPITSSLRW